MWDAKVDACGELVALVHSLNYLQEGTLGVEKRKAQESVMKEHLFQQMLFHHVAAVAHR